MSDDYNGPERRHFDHDRLVRNETMIESIGKDMISFSSAFKEHVKQNKEDFDKVHQEIVSLGKSMVEVAVDVRHQATATTENTELIAKQNGWMLKIVGGGTALATASGAIFAIIKLFFS